MSPEGWKEKTVDELCEFSNGNGFKPSDWSRHGLPIIRIQNLNGSTKFNYFAGVPDEKWLVMPDDLLFAWAGTRGVSFGPTIWKGEKGVLNQHIYRISPKDGVNKEWLYYALLVVTSRIEAKAHGFKSTLVHVHKSEIEKQVIPVPPLVKQIEIANILNTWAAGIRIIERILVSKTIFRRGLSQQLLSGQRRFPEFSQHEWREAALKNFLNESCIAGSDGKKARKLTVKLYGKGVVEKRDQRQGSQGTKYYIRRSGQFIYSKLDFLNGAFGIIPKHLDGYESTLDLPAFDISDEVHPQWLLYYVTRTEFYRRYAQAAEGGRKARRVHPPKFLNTLIRIPSLEEQRRIALILNFCDREIELLSSQLSALKRQKRGLMQKLLTGQIQVSIGDESKEGMVNA
jgi:type I restriction enzyme, S subunit